MAAWAFLAWLCALPWLSWSLEAALSALVPMWAVGGLLALLLLGPAAALQGAALAEYCRVSGRAHRWCLLASLGFAMGALSWLTPPGWCVESSGIRYSSLAWAVLAALWGSARYLFLQAKGLAASLDGRAAPRGNSPGAWPGPQPISPATPREAVAHPDSSAERQSPGSGLPAGPVLEQSWGLPCTATSRRAVAWATGLLFLATVLGWTRLLEQAAPNMLIDALPVVLVPWFLGLGAGAWLAVRKLAYRAGGSLAGLLLAGAALVAGFALISLVPEESLVGQSVGLGPGNLAVFRATGLQISLDRLVFCLSFVAMVGLFSGLSMGGMCLQDGAEAGAQEAFPSLVGWISLGGVSASLAIFSLSESDLGLLSGLALLASLAIAGALLILVSRRAVVLAAPLLAGLWIPPWFGLPIPPGESVESFSENLSSTSAITSHDASRVLYSDGSRVTHPSWPLGQVLSLHPRPSRVLLLGLGTGFLSTALDTNPHVQRIVCVESLFANASMLTWAYDGQPGSGPMGLVGSRDLIKVEPRRFLRLTRESFDLVLWDLKLQYSFLGMNSLEAFQELRNVMQPCALVALKIQPSTLSPQGLRGFLWNFTTVFPDSGMLAGAGAEPVLVGRSPGPTCSAGHDSAGAREASPAPWPGVSTRFLLMDAPAMRRLLAGTASTDAPALASARQTLVGPNSQWTLEHSALPWLRRGVQRSSWSPAVGIVMTRRRWW